MSKFLNGLKQMSKAGIRIAVREVTAVVDASDRIFDNYSEMFDKALEGKPVEVMKIGVNGITEGVKHGFKETKDNLVDGIDMVHGGITAWKGIRQDAKDIAGTIGQKVGGKPGKQIAEILFLTGGSSHDDSDDSDGSTNHNR